MCALGVHENVLNLKNILEKIYMKDLMNDIMSAAGAEVSIIPVVQGDGMLKVDVSFARSAISNG